MTVNGYTPFSPVDFQCLGLALYQGYVSSIINNQLTMMFLDCLFMTTVVFQVPPDFMTETE